MLPCRETVQAPERERLLCIQGEFTGRPEDFRFDSHHFVGSPEWLKHSWSDFRRSFHVMRISPDKPHTDEARMNSFPLIRHRNLICERREQRGVADGNRMEGKCFSGVEWTQEEFSLHHLSVEQAAASLWEFFIISLSLLYDCYKNCRETPSDPATQKSLAQSIHLCRKHCEEGALKPWQQL